MEWMNRGGNAPQNTAQTNTAAPTGAPAAAHRPAASAPSGKKSSKGDNGKLWRAASVALLFTVTLLVVSVIAYMALIKPAGTNQGKYVDTSKYQAVFLNGGQVYFGKITATNSDHMKINDIYYLRVNQQVQPNGQTAQGDVQLVKLGCELHGPDDQMIVNSDQVVFWENLKTDGQVTQAINKYVQENPEGQKCQTATNNNSGQNNNTNTNTNSSSNNTNTNTNNSTN